MKEVKSVRKYETPEIEITRFETDKNLMNENEGPGEIITYESVSGVHDYETFPFED